METISKQLLHEAIRKKKTGPKPLFPEKTPTMFRKAPAHKKAQSDHPMFNKKGIEQYMPKKIP